MLGFGGVGFIIVWKVDGIWLFLFGIIFYIVEFGFVIGVDIYDCVLVINSV